jgi:hypothetical protein
MGPLQTTGLLGIGKQLLSNESLGKTKIADAILSPSFQKKALANLCFPKAVFVFALAPNSFKYKKTQLEADEAQICNAFACRPVVFAASICGLRTAGCFP